MELLIVSGLSGAGKSVAMNALEDIGFFCIDNVPAELLPSITAFSMAGDNQLKRVALSMDVRGCRSSEEIEKALGLLDKQGISYEILFLDAPDDVLMRRYSETRRRHPISIAEGILSTREAFQKEHQILRPFKERANYIIDTALLSTAQNKERICELFVQNGGAKNAMRLTIMSLRVQVRRPGGFRPCAGCALPAQPVLCARAEIQDRPRSGGRGFCDGPPGGAGAAAPVRGIFGICPAALCEKRAKAS